MPFEVIIQMSKISNKIIEAKLLALLQGQDKTDLSKFDDNEALTLIFAFYDDQQDFSEIIMDKHIHQIQELKLIELDLRTQLEFYKKKEAERAEEEWEGDGEGVGSSRIIEKMSQLKQKYQKLKEVCEQQEGVITELEKGEVSLQEKILKGSNRHDEDQKQCANLRAQIESQAAMVQEADLKIKQLLEEREALVKDYEAQIAQYKGEFIQELTKKLNEKYSEELEQSRKIAEGLQQELREKEKLIKTAVGQVSQVFKMPQPADLQEGLRKWVQDLGTKVEGYRRSIMAAVQVDIKEVKDPIKQLADYEKKQVQSRNLMVKKYLLA